ncbi:MAG: RdgB/HAM1 family non-canonical purine NTP pyrophosphatase [Defluviitaleaceae bacterium]|nr:RdgB/HAM1 family non-canonical purine NTP pyrophosphatase [Defluviitaleaceae bacterium]
MYVFATNNKGKSAEIKAIFANAGLELTTLQDLGLTLPPPDETGTTFEENSKIKATETAAFLQHHGHTNAIVLADDSGLAIDAMDGAPGVDSALFLGEDTPYDQRNAHILSTLGNRPYYERGAQFICVITCVLPSGEILTTRGELKGLIAREAKGESGFGYDPIFYSPKRGKHLAEMTKEEKNKISHRGIALKNMLKLLTQ